MQVKDMKWAVFSGFLALLLIVAGVLVFGGSVRAAYPAAVVRRARMGKRAGSKIASSPLAPNVCQTYPEVSTNNTYTQTNPIADPATGLIRGGITPRATRISIRLVLLPAIGCGHTSTPACITQHR